MRWRFGLIVIFSLLSVLLTHWPSAWQPFLEVVYGGHLYPILQNLFLLLPEFHQFALADLLWIIIPILFGLRVFWLLRKNLVRRTISIALELCLWLVTGYLLMMMFWGMHYHREPLYNDLKTQGFTTKLVDGHFDFALTQTLKTLNDLPEGTDICAQQNLFSASRPSALMHSSMALANLKPAPPKMVVASAWSWFLTRIGVGGVYIPFTGEPTYNANIFNASKPFVMTHEFAHWAGYAREYDADILAYWALWLSPDPLWQYSAWLEWWMEVGAPKAYAQQLPAEMKNHLQCYSEHLAQQPRWQIRKSFWRVYEANLKNQGVAEGLKSYRMGASLALSSYQDWLFRKAN